MDMIASGLWYAGLLLAAIGASCVVRPVRRLGIPTRRRAIGVAIAGLVAAALTLLPGGTLKQAEASGAEIDRIIPRFQFNEVHAIEVRAPVARVYRAVRDVTPEEIRFYRVLTSLRRLGRAGPASIMNPPAGRPLLETAVRTSFRLLADAPDREIVFGGFVAAPPGAGARDWTMEEYVGLEASGFAKVAMNFRLEPRGPDVSVLSTETRVYATDASTRRVFKVYWRTIYPGSAIIRSSWLRGIKNRAEASPQ